MPRRQHDFYETPPHYLEALGSVLHLSDGAKVIEPCAGDGAIVRWLTATYPKTYVHCNDIDKRRGWDQWLDARNPDLYTSGLDGFDWWITNPPFNIIDDLLYVALEHCPNVVTLARLSALEPTKGIGEERGRRELYKHYQPDMLIVLPRYCFRLNDKGKRATDSVTCAWIGWGPDVPKVTTVWTED